MESIQFLIYALLIIISLFLLKKYTAGPTFNTSKYDLSNKYAVITGGNSGIGKQTFLQLVRLNCNVIIGARDKRKSQQAVKEALSIIKQKNSEQSQIIQHFYLDLGSKSSVKEFATLVQSRFPKLDFLVNNAGLSLISKQSKTQDGFQMIYGVNHLGHFYLTSLLMKLLNKSELFRIVNVSSMAHKRVLGFLNKVTIDWDNIGFTQQHSFQHNLSYSRSKLYNVLFTKSLAKKIPIKKGISVCLHPGVVRTEITRHQRILQKIMAIFDPIIWFFMKNNKQGAQTTLFSLLDQSVQSGEYYSDCKKDSVNQLTLSIHNQQKLWKISQKDLDHIFEIKY